MLRRVFTGVAPTVSAVAMRSARGRVATFASGRGLSAKQLKTQLASVKASITSLENRHRSNAEQLIAEVPPIEVEGSIAVCDGGGGALGHPLEYIQLDLVNVGEIATCKYCGLRFQQKPGSGHH